MYGRQLEPIFFRPTCIIINVNEHYYITIFITHLPDHKYITIQGTWGKILEWIAQIWWIECHLPFLICQLLLFIICFSYIATCSSLANILPAKVFPRMVFVSSVVKCMIDKWWITIDEFTVSENIYGTLMDTN